MNTRDFHDRVIKDLEDKIKKYELLAKYTRKSVKLKHHRDAIKFLKEVIIEAELEYTIFNN